jgi:taurine dioxygenase
MRIWLVVGKDPLLNNFPTPASDFSGVAGANPFETAPTAPTVPSIQLLETSSLMELFPLFKTFGVEMRGLDPTTHASEETRKQIIDAINEHKLVLIRHADLQAQDQVDFSKILGPINRRGVFMPGQRNHAFVSNAMGEGVLRDGEIFFHSDQTYFNPPLRGLSLYGITIPPKGGNTEFVDAEFAYERLPVALKERIQHLQAMHVHDYSPDKYTKGSEYKFDPNSPNAVKATHPVVWTHPVTGKQVLLVNRSQTSHIIGMDEAESAKLLEQLYSFVEDREHVYAHQWSVGDLVIWDNWGLQHARTEWDPNEKRTLRRVPIGPDSLDASA